MDNNYIPPFLKIKRDNDFNKDILPKIDALAAEQGRIRSDVIRDILYAKFDYEPIAKSQKQINKDHTEERQRERELNYQYIAFRVDKRYLYMFYLNMVAYPGRLDKNCDSFFYQALYEYFVMLVPECYSIMKFEKPIIQPKYPTKIKISNLGEHNITPDFV